MKCGPTGLMSKVRDGDRVRGSCRDVAEWLSSLSVWWMWQQPVRDENNDKSMLVLLTVGLDHTWSLPWHREATSGPWAPAAAPAPQRKFPFCSPGWSWGQMVAPRLWAELRKESERKGGRRAKEGEEEKWGVDTRGEMLRYGSGRNVSTTTTTTEDSAESLSEVRSSREDTAALSLSLCCFCLCFENSLVSPSPPLFVPCCFYSPTLQPLVSCLR